MSELHTCPNPDRFVSALSDMFNKLDPEKIRTRTSEVLQDMIEELRQHQVGVGPVTVGRLTLLCIHDSCVHSACRDQAVAACGCRALV